MQTRVRTLIALVLALTSLGAITERVRDPGVTDTEIRIGNVMPYSGSLAVFGAIGKAEAAYFEMINERGGINGRKVRFISYDDRSDPSAALSLTRDLIEKDDVLLMFGSFGWMELLLILIIVLIIFGAGKIPQLGEGLGKAIKGFKKSVHEADAIDVTPPPVEPAPAQPAPMAQGQAAQPAPAQPEQQVKQG